MAARNARLFAIAGRVIPRINFAYRAFSGQASHSIRLFLKAAPTGRETTERLMRFDPFIRDAQKRLISNGFPLPRFGADGRAGTETREAIEDFQQKHGLPESGMLDAATVALLFGDDDPGGPLPIDRDRDGPEEPVAETMRNVWPRQKDLVR